MNSYWFFLMCSFSISMSSISKIWIRLPHLTCSSSVLVSSQAQQGHFVSQFSPLLASEFWKWNIPWQTKFASNCQLWGKALFIFVYIHITHVCPGQLCRLMKTQVTSLHPRGKRRQVLSWACCRGDLGVQLSLWRLWTIIWASSAPRSWVFLLLCNTKGLASCHLLFLRAFLLCPVC